MEHDVDIASLAGLGFDVNAKGRSDGPADDPRKTARHVAAMRGRLDLARTLLRLGADPDDTDDPETGAVEPDT